MFQNQQQRINEIEDVVLELFRRGAIRSRGDDIIDIIVDHDSVSLLINVEQLQTVVQQVVSRGGTTVNQVVNARMA